MFWRFDEQESDRGRNADGRETYAERGAHADDLDGLSETEELGGEELEEIATAAVVDHVKLVQHDGPQLGDGTVLDGRVHERVGLGQVR